MELEPKEAREKLVEFLGEERFKEVEGTLDLKGKEAHDQNLEFKETEEEEVTEAEVTPEEEIVEPEAVPAEEVVEAKEETIFTKEQTEQILDALSAMNESLTKAVAEVIQPLTEKLTSLEAEVTQLKATDEQKVAEQAAWTTRAAGPSLREIFENRAIGKDEARIDGRLKEAKGPQEATISKSYTGNPILDGAFANIESAWQKGMVVGDDPFKTTL